MTECMPILLLLFPEETIQINRSYEGLEALNILISGGSITVTASDDGINAAGGNDGSSVNGRPGQNNFGLWRKFLRGSLEIPAEISRWTPQETVLIPTERLPSAAVL